MGQILRFVLIVLIFTAAQAAFAYTDEDCVECHREGSKEGGIYINAVLWFEELRQIQCSHHLIVTPDILRSFGVRVPEPA